MKKTNYTLLSILNDSLRSRENPDPELEPAEWQDLLNTAQEQEILSLIFNNIYKYHSIKAIGTQEYLKFRDYSLDICVRQVRQTNEFLQLIKQLQHFGLDPIVLKGIIVRNLYPIPILRPSVDEDIFVRRDQVQLFHDFFIDHGLTPDYPDSDFSISDELSYHKPNSPTYIEVHVNLFPMDSTAYGDCNSLFIGADQRTETQEIDGVILRTLSPTDHLLYLICHSYKHFLHSGAGIRHISDIVMFMNSYETRIDYQYILMQCRKIHIETFTAALFKIGHVNLNLNTIPAAFSNIEVDEKLLLEDVLSAGLYGNTDIDRVHSATMTLSVISAQKTGKSYNGIIKSLFPSASYMIQDYPYIKKRKYLLPVAWTQRIMKYMFVNKKANPRKTIEIGKKRINLLKKYKILQ